MKKTFNSIISNFNYRYALILPVLYSLIVAILHSNAEYSIIKSGVLYLAYEENFFRILFGFLLILNFILFAFYKNKITRGNESFKVFNLTTNAIARKLTINFAIITTAIFLLSVVSEKVIPNVSAELSRAFLQASNWIWNLSEKK